MKNKLSRTNLIVGIMVVILFAITGQLMRHYYHNETAPEVERLFRRSRHLLLLLAGLLQGGIGVYIVAYQHKVLRNLQWVATGLMTLATVLLAIAFFTEIPSEIVKTPISRVSMYLFLGSASLHLVAGILNERLKSRKEF